MHRKLRPGNLPHFPHIQFISSTFANDLRGPPPLEPCGIRDPVATVLIVESDPLQGVLRKSILERQFVDVVRVSDASEALCLIEQPQFAPKLGLVIASHPMQGIGGPAFVAELHTRLPQVPILVLADPDAPAPADLASETNPAPPSGGPIRFLPRPFSIDQLVDLARQMLPRPRLNTA
jgi:DNA-binding NtrC family response regulator